MEHQDLVAVLRASCEKHADQVALRVKRDGAWRETTYRELWERSGRIAAHFLARGLQPGDRVGIFAGNSPEWTLVDVACLRAGLVSVPLYPTSTTEQAGHLLTDSGARLVVVGDTATMRRALRALPTCPAVEGLLLVQGEPPEDPRVVRLQVAETTPTPAELAAELDRRSAAVRPDDLVTLIYTSGTTGRPRGVMLTHRNLVHQLAAIDARFELPRGSRNMSFLPLSHAYERAWTYVVLHRGLSNSCVTDPRSVGDAMLDIRPTSFVSVPRLYEKVYATAYARADTDRARRLLHWALDVGTQVQRRRARGERVPAPLALQHAVADGMILRKVRQAVGGRKHVMAAGGAALRREVEEFFFAAGLVVYQGYGLTEAAPMISCNCPEALRFGTVGTPVPGCQVRIAAETGEILVRGDNVMAGYWNDPEGTAAAIDDGWLHTGDIGHIDKDGFLVVTDRLKDLIVTGQGKNIAPAPIEAAITAHPLVESAVVVGEGRKYLTALVQPAFDNLEAHARRAGWSFGSREHLVTLPDVHRLYTGIVHALGRERAHHERVQKLVVLDRELTMENGEITPTLKVRRGPVEHRFRDEIEAMYSEDA